MKVRKNQAILFPVGKDIKAEVDKRIIIPIMKDPAHYHNIDLVKAAGIIMVISMAADHPLQTSHLMSHKPILMKNTRNAHNIGMKMTVDEKQVGGNHENIVANFPGLTWKLPDFGLFSQILYWFGTATDFSGILKR